MTTDEYLQALNFTATADKETNTLYNTQQLLSEQQIHSACLSYRHDFGLLSKSEQDSVIWAARQWEQAFVKERQYAIQQNANSE